MCRTYIPNSKMLSMKVIMDAYKHRTLQRFFPVVIIENLGKMITNIMLLQQMVTGM